MDARETLARLLYDTDPGYYDPEGSGMLDVATIRADRFISALDAAGFVIVPKEPTKEMLNAIEPALAKLERSESYSLDEIRCIAYGAMLAAAPPPLQKEKPQTQL